MRRLLPLLLLAVLPAWAEPPAAQPLPAVPPPPPGMEAFDSALEQTPEVNVVITEEVVHKSEVPIIQLLQKSA